MKLHKLLDALYMMRFTTNPQDNKDGSYLVEGDHLALDINYTQPLEIDVDKLQRYLTIHSRLQLYLDTVHQKLDELYKLGDNSHVLKLRSWMRDYGEMEMYAISKYNGMDERVLQLLDRSIQFLDTEPDMPKLKVRFTAEDIQMTIDRLYRVVVETDRS